MKFSRLGLLAVLGALGLFLFSHTAANAFAVPQPLYDAPLAPTPTTATAVFGGGCFWGVQGVFQHVRGVLQAVSGYSGGAAATAHYEQVSTGTTGHAESVEITYDPHQITYGTLLQIFFAVAHDPTELNRQGPDSGSQYRSVIFPQDDDQKRIAAGYIAQLNKSHLFSAPIVTAIEPFQDFYPAEDHHQNFLTLNPNNPYIAINDIPKVQHLRQIFPTLYRDKPVLVTLGSN